MIRINSGWHDVPSLCSESHFSTNRNMLQLPGGLCIHIYGLLKKSAPCNYQTRTELLVSAGSLAFQLQIPSSGLRSPELTCQVQTPQLLTGVCTAALTGPSSQFIVTLSLSFLYLQRYCPIIQYYEHFSLLSFLYRPQSDNGAASEMLVPVVML